MRGGRPAVPRTQRRTGQGAGLTHGDRVMSPLRDPPAVGRRFVGRGMTCLAYGTAMRAANPPTLASPPRPPVRAAADPNRRHGRGDGRLVRRGQGALPRSLGGRARNVAPRVPRPPDRRIMIFAGGIPISRDGRVVGAVGVSGGSGEQDQTVAEAGAGAL